ncbi:MAG: ATP-dependent Clp protease ATP-binding subunit [bacterium]|nr:ATP-dependent Clp protease ATP-binding subunit [bacterium]
MKRFTTHLKNTVVKAAELASDWKHSQVLPEHLFYGLTFQRGSLGAEILNKLGLNRVNTGKAMLSRQPKANASSQRPRFSAASKDVLMRAGHSAHHFEHHYIGTEHLLHALMLANIPAISDILKKSSIEKKQVDRQLRLVLKSTSKFPDLTEMFEKNNTDFKADSSKTPALDYFCVDLSSDEVQKKLDPVIGRSDEIQRLIHILSRRTKNNPVLIGDPGVGKTAIVEGLAKRIAQHDVPDALLHKRIVSLDLGLVIAGTMYRGEFESRFKQIIEEITRNSNIILFIDELHTIMGTGGATGTLDAANILKPALAKGQIRCVGATTLDEYRKHIESDPALERRFQPIIVDEPNAAEALEVLRGLRENYERFHAVTISDEALNAAVQLSQRYIQDKFLPDKAIDLMDEAASKHKVGKKRSKSMEKIILLRRKLDALEKLKAKAVSEEQFAAAMTHKGEVEKLNIELQGLEKEHEDDLRRGSGTITEHDIAEIVSTMTKVPLHELMSGEKNRLIHLEKTLSRKIIGQAEAVTAVAQSIRRSRARLSAPNRPIASFMFLGPSGVGKTELAKVIAREVFNDEKALVRLDMSEFGESFQTSKLIGAPAGYVGYKDGTKLTDLVRRKPYSVVLFDEIEKAHPDVFNLLLQVLEDGHLTDASGKTINFKNTVVILTSNIGLEDLNRVASLGFSEENDDTATAEEEYTQVRGRLLESLHEVFRPEFLNRLDKTVVFRPLGKKDVEKIVRLQLDELIDRLRSHNFQLRISPRAIKNIASRGFEPSVGARAIRRIIQEEIEPQLADLILNSESKNVHSAKISLKGERVVVTG